MLLYIYIYISNFRSQITHSFVKCDCSIYCFLTLSTLICRSMDISKYFSESLGIQDNESRLYNVAIPAYLTEALLMSTHNICFHGEIRKILCGYPFFSGAMGLYNFIKSMFLQKKIKPNARSRNEPVTTGNGASQKIGSVMGNQTAWTGLMNQIKIVQVTFFFHQQVFNILHVSHYM